MLHVDTVEEVRKKIDSNFADLWQEFDEINIEESLGRIVFADYYSSIELPEFSRSVVDGYAVCAKDTFGASESMPVFLEVVGHVEMGKPTFERVESGKAIYVPTGGMIPEGADSVVMIEYVENLDETNIAVNTPVPPNGGIIKKADDIQQCEKILHKGLKIKSRHIGVLSALGIEKIKVFRKVGLTIISTGDEIVPSFGAVAPGQVRDINTHLLSAMGEEAGAEIKLKMLIEDDFEKLVTGINKALESSQIVILSGGSSVGMKDMTAKAIETLPDGEVFVHGVAVKPGKPTIIGKSGGKAVFGLPGHPSSAMIIFKVFVEYLIRSYYCQKEDSIYVEGVCTENIHSAPGKETYQAVELIDKEEKYEVAPIYGKSAAISSVAKASGFIKIPQNKEGIKAGEKVKVELF